jgi:hypothetical protein
MRTRKFTALCLVILLNVSAVLACSFPFADSGNETDESGTTATVTQAAPTATETEFAIETETAASTAEASATQTPTLTATPPTGGVSLNCDGTYQRVRITDHGSAGKTISVDNRSGGAWVNVWNMASGDPNQRQLMPEAGTYGFGECRLLVVVPMRSSGPHLWYELGIYAWNGVGLSQVYYNEGYYGEWSKIGDVITFREASTLGGSPLSPCEWMTLEHEWDGTDFFQIGSALEPVAGCTPIVP